MIKQKEDRQRCHTMGIDNFHHYLDRISVSEFPVVIDHIFDQQAWHERTLEAFKRRPTILVAVRCDLEILEQREKKRADRRIGLSPLQHDRVHEAVAYDLELDTSAKSAAECAKLIMKYTIGKRADQSIETTKAVARPKRLA